MRSTRFVLQLLVAVSAMVLAASPCLAQVTAHLGIDEDRLAGAAPDGRMMLYAPDPVSSGSSISHWDPIATPNLLMEPNIGELEHLDLDLTPALLKDIGWSEGTSVFTIYNLDPDGTGFTDPTPFDGAPGNPATTLGEARLNLFNEIILTWATTLGSTVDIDVLVTWQALPCEAGGGAVLAGAASTFIFRDDAAFPRQGVWYHSALAEALAGTDLSGAPADDGGDLFVIVNSDIDNACLGEGIGYYYGLDGNNPSNQIDMTPVVLHELAHGLGFANFTTEATGQLTLDTPGIYDVFTLDTTTGKTWDQMNNAERVASATNFRRVVWKGDQVTAAAPGRLQTGVAQLRIDAPAHLAGVYEVGTAQFGPSLSAAGITAGVACMVDDEADPSLFNGCTPAINPDELAGKIALIDRGICSFSTKVANAQAAGAVAAIIVNNAGDMPVTLGGDDPSITIPAIGLGRSDGNRIRNAVCPDLVHVINDRFQITVDWASDSQTGTGTPVALSDESVYFWFFNPNNVELVVKVLNACELPGFNNYWVFAAGLTNVEVDITVLDMQSGQSQSYNNPLGQPFQPIQDTAAFATCP